MAKKTMCYRCYWKENNEGYTYTEAERVKSEVDYRNSLAIYRNRKQCGKAEIVEDPRGGYMVCCSEL